MKSKHKVWEKNMSLTISKSILESAWCPDMFTASIDSTALSTLSSSNIYDFSLPLLSFKTFSQFFLLSGWPTFAHCYWQNWNTLDKTPHKNQSKLMRDTGWVVGFSHPHTHTRRDSRQDVAVSLPLAALNVVHSIFSDTHVIIRLQSCTCYTGFVFFWHYKCSEHRTLERKTAQLWWKYFPQQNATQSFNPFRHLNTLCVFVFFLINNIEPLSTLLNKFSIIWYK